MPVCRFPAIPRHETCWLIVGSADCHGHQHIRTVSDQDASGCFKSATRGYTHLFACKISYVMPADHMWIMRRSRTYAHLRIGSIGQRGRHGAPRYCRFNRGLTSGSSTKLVMSCSLGYTGPVCRFLSKVYRYPVHGPECRGFHDANH